MPKFCPNLSTMFTENAFLDRFDAAADTDFQAVECQFPYVETAEAIEQKLLTNNLQLVLHNLPAGDWKAGEKGIACLPDRVDEFQEGVEHAIEYATLLDCKQLNLLAGITPTGVSLEQLNETLLQNIDYAAKALKPLGIKLLVEAINTQDVPGFFVNNTAQILSLIDSLDENCDNVFLQYDIYHMQIMEGNLAKKITDNLDKISHIQLADNPLRHEPGTGEINFPFLFDTLDELGYDGWVGCEYFPQSDTVSGLAWLDDYLSK